MFYQQMRHDTNLSEMLWSDVGIEEMLYRKRQVADDA